MSNGASSGLRLLGLELEPELETKHPFQSITELLVNENLLRVGEVIWRLGRRRFGLTIIRFVPSWARQIWDCVVGLC